MAKLNAAWQAASSEMYNASNANAGGSTADAGEQGKESSSDNVSDVEYEEVNDTKK